MILKRKNQNNFDLITTAIIKHSSIHFLITTTTICYENQDKCNKKELLKKNAFFYESMHCLF